MPEYRIDWDVVAVVVEPLRFPQSDAWVFAESVPDRPAKRARHRYMYMSCSCNTCNSGKPEWSFWDIYCNTDRLSDSELRQCETRRLASHP